MNKNQSEKVNKTIAELDKVIVELKAIEKQAKARKLKFKKLEEDIELHKKSSSVEQ